MAAPGPSTGGDGQLTPPSAVMVHGSGEAWRFADQQADYHSVLMTLNGTPIEVAVVSLLGTAEFLVALPQAALTALAGLPEGEFFKSTTALLSALGDRSTESSLACCSAHSLPSSSLNRRWRSPTSYRKELCSLPRTAACRIGTPCGWAQSSTSRPSASRWPTRRRTTFCAPPSNLVSAKWLRQESPPQRLPGLPFEGVAAVEGVVVDLRPLLRLLRAFLRSSGRA